jgi:hypothetical protein
MNLCSVFNSNPTFTAVTTTTLTVSGLTPAGFVKTATGAGGLLSTEAFGANTYIPYSSGSGFTYSANLTFNGSQLGVGTAVSAANGIAAVNTTTGTTAINGVFGSTIFSGTGTCAGLIGLYFSSKYMPGDLAAPNKTVPAFIGCQVGLEATTIAGEAQSVTFTAAYCFRPITINLTRGAGASGAMTVTNMYQYATLNPTLTNTPAITTLYGFYDPGLTVGGTNWGCAINTQSYFNANVRIGSAVAPTVALDVTGGNKRTVSTTKTTTYQILITDYTIVCEHATVVFTVTLPAASATTIGQIFHIKNIGAAIVSVDQTGTDTLDGYTTTADLSQWDCICIQGQSATGWIII